MFIEVTSGQPLIRDGMFAYRSTRSNEIKVTINNGDSSLLKKNELVKMAGVGCPHQGR